MFYMKILYQSFYFKIASLIQSMCYLLFFIINSAGELLSENCLYTNFFKP